MKDDEIELTEHDSNVLDTLMPNLKKVKEREYVRTEATPIEIEAIKIIEQGNLQKAIELLSDAISKYPNNPSLYNNRAQAYRLIKQDDLALNDLTRAKSLPLYPYVEGKINEQLGWLLFKDGDTEAALKYFERAAELGSEDAKRMAVRCNPFAELCNAMFREALSGNNLLFSRERNDK